MRDFTQAMEGLGFHSVWLPEHLVFFENYESVYPYAPTPGSSEEHRVPVGKRPGMYDPLLLAQAIALGTTTLRIGSAVALLPLRHPLLWAREIATLDHFSNGRFDFGIGVGWLREEFEALNVPFGTRGRMTDDYLGALRSLWTQEQATHHGEFVRFKTTRRAHYDAFTPTQPGVFDTLLWNSEGEITECTRGNVALLLDGRWVTPPLRCGLLDGIGRAKELHAGRLSETVVRLDDLPRVQALAFVNSLRGWIAADLDCGV